MLHGIAECCSLWSDERTDDTRDPNPSPLSSGCVLECVLEYVAACVAECCSVCCSMLECVAACCSVLLDERTDDTRDPNPSPLSSGCVLQCELECVLQYVTVCLAECCRVLQSVVVLQCVAVRCSASSYESTDDILDQDPSTLPVGCVLQYELEGVLQYDTVCVVECCRVLQNVVVLQCVALCRQTSAPTTPLTSTTFHSYLVVCCSMSGSVHCSML